MLLNINKNSQGKPISVFQRFEIWEKVHFPTMISKHVTKSTHSMFWVKHLNILECPSLYQDLNPIENIWYNLKFKTHQ